MSLLFDLSHCRMCPRQCGVDRRVHKGFCGMGLNPVLARAFSHMGEEPCISGTRGAGTVFFSGCSLQCAFCQNRPISRDGIGWTLTVRGLADVFSRLADSGVHNISLVTPTHQAHAVEAAFRLLEAEGAPVRLPVIWNSAGYDAVETIRVMSRWVTVWMPDLKFHDPELSGKLSGAPDYFVSATKAIREMARLAGPATYDTDGMMTGGLMIRHLVLPGHTRDSIRVLEWVAAEFGGAVPVSLMSQYTPMPDAPDAPDRPLTRKEYDRVVDALYRLGLENGYLQERTSATTALVPEWDGKGVRAAP